MHDKRLPESPWRTDEDDYDWQLDLAWESPQGTGSVTTTSEVPNKRKKKVYRRPIGYLADIDKLEEAE